MKRWAAWMAGLVALLAASSAEARATFGPVAGVLVLPGDSLATYDFESADALVGAEIVQWNTNSPNYYPTLDLKPIMAGSDVSSRIVGVADAVEGQHAIRLGDGLTGFGITDPQVLGK